MGLDARANTARTWTNATGDGDFRNAGNWSPSGFISGRDQLTINTGTATHVSGWDLGDGGTLHAIGASSAFDFSGFPVTVGPGGTLRLGDGALFTADTLRWFGGTLDLHPESELDLNTLSLRGGDATLGGLTLGIEQDRAGQLTLVPNQNVHVAGHLQLSHSSTLDTSDAARITVPNEASLFAGSMGMGFQSGSANELIVEAGGTLEVDGNFTAGFWDLTSSAITVHGTFKQNQFVNNERVQLGSSSSDVFAGFANMVVEDGGVGTAPILKLERRGTLTLRNGGRWNGFTVESGGPLGTINLEPGGVLSVGLVDGDLTNAGGTIAPGSRDGDAPTVRMRVAGDLTLDANGTLDLGIDAGLGTSPNDRINVEGLLAAAGTVSVSLLNGYTPSAGQSYDLLEWASRTGTFDALDLPDLSALGLAWDTSEWFGGGVLAVVAAATLAGDYNGSGQVEQGDLDLVLQNWGVNTDTAGVPVGWINDLPDGQIEQAELDGILQNWGGTAAPNSVGASLPEAGVPEPATAGVLVLGGLACLFRCRV